MIECASKVSLIIAAWLFVCPESVGASSATWKGRVEVRDGIQYVANPDAGFMPERTLDTREVWRRGGEDDEEALFGRISDITMDSDGNTYLLDSQLNQLHVIDPDGNYSEPIGRSGEGPGEFRRSCGVVLLSDSTLCIPQVVPGRAVLLTIDGRALSDHPLPHDPEGGSFYINGCAAVNSQLLLNLAQMIQKEASVEMKTSFVRIDSIGRIATTYWQQIKSADFANMTFDEKTDGGPVWSVGNDGRFYINDDWDSYSIRVIDGNGSLEHVIERSYKHRMRSTEEIEQVEELKRAGKISPKTKVSETSRGIVKILPRNDGLLWVLSSRGERDVPEGTIGAFDVFDQEGRFEHQVTIHGPYRPDRDKFYLIGDFILILTNVSISAGEDEKSSGAENRGSVDPMQVICLKLLDGQ